MDISNFSGSSSSGFCSQSKSDTSRSGRSLGNFGLVVRKKNCRSLIRFVRRQKSINHRMKSFLRKTQTKNRDRRLRHSRKNQIHQPLLGPNLFRKLRTHSLRQRKNQMSVQRLRNFVRTLGHFGPRLLRPITPFSLQKCRRLFTSF